MAHGKSNHIIVAIQILLRIIDQWGLYITRKYSRIRQVMMMMMKEWTLTWH